MYPQTMAGHFTAKRPWGKAEGAGPSPERSAPRPRRARSRHGLSPTVSSANSSAPEWDTTAERRRPSTSPTCGLSRHRQGDLSPDSSAPPSRPRGPCAPCAVLRVLCTMTWASGSLSAGGNVPPCCPPCPETLWTVCVPAPPSPPAQAHLDCRALPPGLDPGPDWEACPALLLGKLEGVGPHQERPGQVHIHFRGS